MSNYMQHLNKRRFVGVMLKTAGPDVGRHSVIEICLIAGHEDGTPNTKIVPFHTFLQPENMDSPDAKDSDFLDALEYGISYEIFYTEFEKWYNTLGLGEDTYGNKVKMIPIVYDARKLEFLRYILVEEYDDYFHHPRDILQISQYLNDKAGIDSFDTPFPKYTFAYICNCLSMPLKRPRSLPTDCIAVMNAYSRMMRA